MKSLNKGLINCVCLFFLSIIFSCSAGNVQKGETEAEIRAKKDTALSFQGIMLGEPLDTARYSELWNGLPLKLYTSNNEELNFTKFSVDTLASWTDSHNVNGINISNDETQPFYTMSIVALYEEQYGCFSYYERRKLSTNESSGILRIGENNPRTNKPYIRIDAVNSFFENRQLLDADDYVYDFVWEWNNQSIIVRSMPRLSGHRSSVYYVNRGYKQRMEEQEALKKEKQEEENRKTEAKAKQQI